MPKIDWERLSESQRRHLYRRAMERQISEEDLARLAQWKKTDPDVPEGEWVKDFGSFKLVGEGRYPKTFLLPGQAARGHEIG